VFGGTYHLERPNSSYPDLKLAFYTPDIVKLNTFPPASASGLPPEQQQLLGHADSIAVREVVTLNIGPQTCKSNTTDDSLVRFSGAMTPMVIVVEATALELAYVLNPKRDKLTLQSASR
jgi:hypothetical protein